MGTLILLFFLLYIVPCILAGLLGIAIKNHFWCYFGLSVFLTPIVGLIVVLYDAFGHHGPQNQHDSYWENITGNKLD